MDNKKVVRDLIDNVWTKGDYDVLDRYLSPSWVDHDPLDPQFARGLAGARAGIEALKTAFPDIRMTVEQQLAEGDLVCTAWRAIGTNTGRFLGMNPTNRKVEMAGIEIDRLENGKIVETWTKFDSLGMMQQLGFVPRTPSSQPPTERTQPRAK